jgi:VWFA-related protein
MSLKMKGFGTTALLIALTAGLSAQTPAPTSGAAGAQEQPTFKIQVDLVTSDIIVRDEKGNFIPDLKKEEFEIYEDGVKQDITSMTVVTGGRVTNVLAPPPPPPPEGIILPPSRPKTDVSGRIFLFFVDDLHLQFHNTGRVRELFKKISKELVHDGDMFGIVSSGPSSIAIDMTYDRSRLDEAIKKIAGNELKPTDIIQGPSGAEGPSEVRYRAHVAFSTVNDLLNNLNSVTNRRKALIYVSDGYDFNPFQDARLGLMDPSSPFAQNEMRRNERQSTEDGANDPLTNQQKQSEVFADADLARELGELTRSANRANVTMYTIDPRGLVGMGDIDEQVDPQQWNEYVRKSQDSLRVIAEETGGIAVVNQNDFSKALKRIDAETSDYYVLGYYSKNPDASKRRRQVEVKVSRKDASTWFRKEYVLKPPPTSSLKK